MDSLPFSAIMKLYTKYEDANTYYLKMCEEVGIHCTRLYRAKKKAWLDPSFKNKNDVETIKRSLRKATGDYKKSKRRVEAKVSSCKQKIEIYNSRVNHTLEVKNSSELRCVASILKWCQYPVIWKFYSGLHPERRMYLEKVARTLVLPKPFVL